MLKRRKPIEEPIINLTPLIDVVFVVLFTFIIVAPLLEIDKILLAPSGEKKESVFEKTPLTLHVYADNSISLNQRKIALNALPGELKKIQKTSSKIQVFQDARSHFGTFQRIKNALEKAGFEEMDIVLQP